jgi:hypothetical protein
VLGAVAVAMLARESPIRLNSHSSGAIGAPGGTSQECGAAGRERLALTRGASIDSRGRRKVLLKKTALVSCFHMRSRTAISA